MFSVGPRSATSGCGTYSEISDSQGDNIVIGEDLQWVVSEHAEDDQDVPDYSDGNETTQDENGKNSLPAKVYNTLLHARKSSIITINQTRSR